MSAPKQIPVGSVVVLQNDRSLLHGRIGIVTGQETFRCWVRYARPIEIPCNPVMKQQKWVLPKCELFVITADINFEI